MSSVLHCDKFTLIDHRELAITDGTLQIVLQRIAVAKAIFFIKTPCFLFFNSFHSI